METIRVPGDFGEESYGAEDEEHEQHRRVLEVVEVFCVEPAVDDVVEVGGVEELDAEVDQGAQGNHVELQEPEPARHARDRVPHPAAKPPGIGNVPDHGIEGVPHADQQEEGPRDCMPAKRSHANAGAPAEIAIGQCAGERRRNKEEQRF